MNDVLRDLLEGYLDLGTAPAPLISKEFNVGLTVNKTLVWLTTKEVVEKYKFDPVEHTDKLKSKIQFNPTCTCANRLWLEDSVASFEVPNPPKNIRERISREIQDQYNAMRS